MKKDAYFFPHYCNARHDRKIKRVTKELGVEGYGIYFMLLEVLREQVDFRYPLSDIDLLAEEFKTSEAKLNAVIRNYDLFQVDELDNFISLKLVFYLQPYIEKSERARLAANIRWTNTKKQLNPPKVDANAYANALPEHSKSIANAMQGEEKRVENTKVKNTKGFIAPSFDEVSAYVIEKEYVVNPMSFYDYYTAVDWIKANGKPVANWKGTLSQWNSKELNENANRKPWKPIASTERKQEKPIYMQSFVPEEIADE